MWKDLLERIDKQMLRKCIRTFSTVFWNHDTSKLLTLHKLKTLELVDEHNPKKWKHKHSLMIALQKLKTQEQVNDFTPKNWKHKNPAMTTLQKLKTRELVDDRSSRVKNTKIDWWSQSDDRTSTVENHTHLTRQI